MGESSSLQDSGSDSILSKSSLDMLIAKSPPDKKDCRKYSEKHNFLDSCAEVQKDSFKWIPNPSESILHCGRSDKHRNTLLLEKQLTEAYSRYKDEAGRKRKEPNTSVSTLESEKTCSNSSSSDFTTNTYNKNGYIKATKRPSLANQSMLKYNEFNSLGSSIGTYPIEVQLAEGKLKMSGPPPPAPPAEPVSTKAILHRLDRHDENTVFLITGGIQMMLGILMAVFGVLVIVHDASLAGAGSGLWGGAVAMLSGLSGVIAGLKGCYITSKKSQDSKFSPTLLTAYLALCLISFALSNLVLVLTATGLFRDIQRPHILDQIDEDASAEENEMTWAPVLSNSGLIISCGIQCIVAVISGYKCYKKVCPCLRKEHERLNEPEVEKYKADGKDSLVTHWLGQQFTTLQSNKRKRNTNTLSSNQTWGAPNIVLLPHPPPPMIANGQVPILTFLQAPPSLLASPNSHLFVPSPPSTNHSHCCCGHHDSRWEQNVPVVTHERRHRPSYIQPDPVTPRKKKRLREKKRERRISLPTAEEVARTYTGLDREIAEEFIAISMDKTKRRRVRSNSVDDYNLSVPNIS